MNNDAIVCAHCGHAYDASIDMHFLVLNPLEERKVYEDGGKKLAVSPPRYTREAPELHLCSTRCFAAFVKNDANFARIAVMQPAMLPSEPEETATAHERFASLFPGEITPEQRNSPEFHAFRDRNVFHAHVRWETAREGKLRCACTPKSGGLVHLIEHAIGDQGDTPCRLCRGPFFYLWNPSTRRELCFGGVACALHWAEIGQNHFDAKGYWKERGDRCATCGSTFRTDLYVGGSGAIKLNVLENGVVKTLHFCSPTCALTKVESGQIDLAKISFEEHVRDGWHDYCHHCKQTNREARFIIVDAPYDSTFDDEIDGHFDSMECFLEALRAEVVHFAKRGFDKWYVDHPHALEGLPH